MAIHEFTENRSTDFLDLAGKLDQESIAPTIQQLVKTGRTAAPLVVDLDPTFLCDLKCPECISKPLLGPRSFPAERLITVAEELADAGVKAVVIIGGGEPLMHRGTPRLMEVLLQRGLSVGLVTNGTRLPFCSPKTLSQLSWVRVSMDSAQAETYQAVRPSARGLRGFAIALRGIKHAVSSSSRVGYCFVATVRRLPDGGYWNNFDEIPQAAKLSKELGCAYLEVKALMRYDHHVDSLTSGELEQLRHMVDEARTFADTDFRVILSGSMRSMIHDTLPARQEKSYTDCRMANLRTLVTPTGVYVCGYHRGDERFKIGDLSNQSFADLWRSASQTLVDPSRDCGFYCARHESNLRLARIAEYGNDTIPEKDYDLFI